MARPSRFKRSRTPTCWPGGSTLTLARAVEPAPHGEETPDQAQANEAALIIMATHGRPGPSHLVLGSVSEQVLRSTYLPGLLPPPAALSAGHAERLARRVVVPYDSSALSASIFLIGQTPGAPVTLVQAGNPPPLSPTPLWTSAGRSRGRI